MSLHLLNVNVFVLFYCFNLVSFSQILLQCTVVTAQSCLRKELQIESMEERRGMGVGGDFKMLLLSYRAPENPHNQLLQLSDKLQKLTNSIIHLWH